MNGLTRLADLAWEHKPWIFWSLVALFFALARWLGRLERKWRLSGDAVCLVLSALAQAVFMPFFGFLTYQSFARPERFDAYADPISRCADDARNFWPLLALLEAFLFACTVCFASRVCRRGLMKR